MHQKLESLNQSWIKLLFHKQLKEIHIHSTKITASPFSAACETPRKTLQSVSWGEGCILFNVPRVMESYFQHNQISLQNTFYINLNTYKIGRGVEQQCNNLFLFSLRYSYSSMLSSFHGLETILSIWTYLLSLWSLLSYFTCYYHPFVAREKWCICHWSFNNLILAFCFTITGSFTITIFFYNCFL